MPPHRPANLIFASRHNSDPIPYNRRWLCKTIEKIFPKRGKFLELQKHALTTTQLPSITTYPPRKNHQFASSFSATPLKKRRKTGVFAPVIVPEKNLQISQSF